MKKITYYSTNNKSHRVDFETALFEGLAPDYGLYMVAREDIPRLSYEKVRSMRGMLYSEIAFEVLSPFLLSEIPEKKLR
ncbi:MAG TPA: hypothetical protein PLM71_03445, partial [Syntrophorhabdaceae bacterium]|nr:hypothetical protein [Syntrophorhabdaceae bacterium]